MIPRSIFSNGDRELTGNRRAFKSWVIYFVPVLYIATVLLSYGNNYFGLFLKALKNPDGTPRWSTSEVNAIPIGGSAINVVFGTCEILWNPREEPRLT